MGREGPSSLNRIGLLMLLGQTTPTSPLCAPPGLEKLGTGMRLNDCLVTFSTFVFFGAHAPGEKKKEESKSKNGPSARALGLTVHMPIWTLQCFCFCALRFKLRVTFLP